MRIGQVKRPRALRHFRKSEKEPGSKWRDINTCHDLRPTEILRISEFHQIRRTLQTIGCGGVQIRCAHEEVATRLSGEAHRDLTQIDARARGDRHNVGMARE